MHTGYKDPSTARLPQTATSLLCFR
uniref:Uncharacterized protein n=1 Tax=Arundo donax TaxID=35708 RepID=A0A0A9HV39_ARUDO